MWRLRRDGRSKALPQTWQGSKGRWRVGLPDDEADVTARPDLPPVIWWWWWWPCNKSVSEEASRPDVLLAISSAPDERPTDCSLDTDWRPSEAPPEATAVVTGCWAGCW